MNLFHKSKPRRAHRRTRTWLDKHPEYGEELIDQIKTSPGFRAAIIEAATGIHFDREELERMDPKSFFSLQKLIAKKIGLNKRLPFPENDTAFFNAFAPANSRTRQLKLLVDLTEDTSFPDLIPLDSQETGEVAQYYRPVFTRWRPVPARWPYRQRQTPRVVPQNKPDAQAQDVVELLQLLVKAVSEQTATQDSPPKVYATEINGEMVEISEAEYEVFRKRRQQATQNVEETAPSVSTDDPLPEKPSSNNNHPQEPR